MTKAKWNCLLTPEILATRMKFGAEFFSCILFLFVKILVFFRFLAFRFLGRKCNKKSMCVSESTQRNALN